MTLFFVLSGFLITVLLLEENESRGDISLGHFYARRAIRLLPALTVFLTAITVFVLLTPYDIAHPTVAVAALLYIVNWLLTEHLTISAVQHTWSLSVEEQFYLLWPLVLFVALKLGGRRGLLTTALVGVGASLVINVHFWGGGDAALLRAYYGSDTRAYGLLLGCALAAWMTGRPQKPERLWAPIILSVAVVILSLNAWSPDPWWQSIGSAIGAGFLAVPMIWFAAHQTGHSLLTHRVITYLGRRSYGLYLWHYPFVPLTYYVGWGGAGMMLGVILGGLLLAEASWRFVEAPASRLRARLGQSRGEQTVHRQGDDQETLLSAESCIHELAASTQCDAHESPEADGVPGRPHHHHQGL